MKRLDVRDCSSDFLQALIRCLEDEQLRLKPISHEVLEGARAALSRAPGYHISYQSDLT